MAISRELDMIALVPTLLVVPSAPSEMRTWHLTHTHTHAHTYLS